MEIDDFTVPAGRSWLGRAFVSEAAAPPLLYRDIMALFFKY
jgi:hypothetical protein